MTTSSARPAPYRENPPPNGSYSSSLAAADATLEFGRFHILLRRRQLVADGVPGLVSSLRVSDPQLLPTCPQ
jgi:hypothetical protein